jgi:hypothetical protein
MKHIEQFLCRFLATFKKKHAPERQLLHPVQFLLCLTPNSKALLQHQIGSQQLAN